MKSSQSVLFSATLAFALLACRKAPVEANPVADAAATPAATADPSVQVADGEHVADAAAETPTALPPGRPLVRMPRRSTAPTNCGQHPEQPGCNCFTSHPNSTCADP